MSNSDVNIVIGADITQYEKDLEALKIKTQEFLKYVRKTPAAEIKLKYGVPSKKALEEAIIKQINDINNSLAKNLAVKVPASAVKQDKSAAAKAESEAAKQVAIAEKAALAEQKAAEKAALAKEKLREREDRIYNDYLSHQTSQAEKAAARQDRLYNDYLSHQAAGLKKQEELSRKSSIDDHGMPRLRYALYDVAAGAQRVSDVLLGITGNAIDTAASFETAFTRINAHLRTNRCNTTNILEC